MFAKLPNCTWNSSASRCVLCPGKGCQHLGKEVIYCCGQLCGAGFSHFLEPAGRLTLLLIQPPCELGKHMFWFILCIICHLRSYLCPCAPYTQCQIKSVLFAWRGRRSVCVVWPKSRLIHQPLVLHHWGGVLLCFTF